MTEQKKIQILPESYELLAFVVLSMCPYPLFKASVRNICEYYRNCVTQLCVICYQRHFECGTPTGQAGQTTLNQLSKWSFFGRTLVSIQLIVIIFTLNKTHC